MVRDTQSPLLSDSGQIGLANNSGCQCRIRRVSGAASEGHIPLAPKTPCVFCLSSDLVRFLSLIRLAFGEQFVQIASNQELEEKEHDELPVEGDTSCSGYSS